MLSAFSFQEILSQLITQAGVTGQTPLQLFRAWVATNNVCSEIIGGSTVPSSFNGFPFSCRPSEAALDQVAATLPPPVVAAGYSFGAATALRVGLRDSRVSELILVARPDRASGAAVRTLLARMLPTLETKADVVIDLRGGAPRAIKGALEG